MERAVVYAIPPLVVSGKTPHRLSTTGRPSQYLLERSNPFFRTRSRFVIDHASFPSRRLFLSALTFGTAAWTVQGAFAEELARTPRLTEGPFYPRRLPLDTDNDLLVINKSITPAVGTITHQTGRVLSLSGEPIKTPSPEPGQS